MAINEREAERQRQWQEAEAKRKAEREAAEARAAELLKQSLDEPQRRSYETHRRFTVVASDGSRYEVDCTKRMHNVFALDPKGKRVEEFCIYQTGDCPLPDNHFAQKLLLEADVDRFKQIANRRPVALAA